MDADGYQQTRKLQNWIKDVRNISKLTGEAILTKIYKNGEFHIENLSKKIHSQSQREKFC